MALGVVEVGGNRHHRLGHLVPQVGAGIIRQFAQHLGRHLFRRKLFGQDRASNFQPAAGVLHPIGHFLEFLAHLLGATANEALGGIEGVVRVHHRLTLGNLPDKLVLVLGVGHHGRGGAEPLGIGDHRGFATLHHGDAAIGGAEINANDLAHGCDTGKRDC